MVAIYAERQREDGGVEREGGGGETGGSGERRGGVGGGEREKERNTMSEEKIEPE